MTLCLVCLYFVLLYQKNTDAVVLDDHHETYFTDFSFDDPNTNHVVCAQKLFVEKEIIFFLMCCVINRHLPKEF